MRIGLLAPDLTTAHGWGRYTLDLARALAADGEARFVIAAASGSPAAPDLPGELSAALDGYLPILPPLFDAARWTTPRALLAVPRLARAMRGCDVIYAAAEHFLPAAALTAWWLRRPLFASAYGTYLPLQARRRGIGRLYRWAARRATILAISRYTAAQVRDALPDLPEQAVQVLLTGVAADRFATPPDVLPQPAGPTVLGVGVNKARKGFHVLLAAMAEARQTVPDARCVIIGDDRDAAYGRRLRGLIETRGLGDAVQVLGRVPDETLLGWYHAADVFALPSINVGGKFEGFGLVYLEAGAAGLPVIGTWGCGAEEAIDDGVTGLLVPQDDPSALAEAITRLLRDPDLRAQLGAAGREKAFANTWAHVAAQVYALYEREC